MQLPHDSAGFLTGDAIADIRRTNTTLSAIQADIAAIKRGVLAGNSSRLGGATGPNINRAARSSSTGNSGSDTASPRPRTRRAGQLPPGQSGSQASPSPVNGGGASPRRRGAGGAPGVNTDNPPMLPPAGESAEPRQRRQRSISPAPGRRERDANGRFTSNNEGDRAEEDRKQRRLFNGMGDRIADAVTGSTTGLEEVDPNIKAFNEIAQPLARGYQLFAGGDKEDRWYRRIFGELRLFRRDQTTFNRAEQRTLREIDANTENPAGSNAGGQSFLGGLLGGITPVVMSALAGIGGVLLTGITSVLSVVFGPIGLAIGAAAAVAWGLFTEDGRKFFTNAADSFKVGMEAATDYLKSKWDEGVKAFSDVWAPIGKFFADKFGIVGDVVKSAADKVSDLAGKANDFIKDKTGVDVKAGVTAVASAIKTGVNDSIIAPAANAVKNGKEKFDLLRAALGFDGGKNITGLTESQTKALAAETQRTESGGNQRAENEYGYIGKYQFGADALAESGLVDMAKLKEAKRKSGKNWFKGGQAGFLNNNDNWLGDGGKEAYLNDSALQDKAFVDYTNKNISSGIRSGAISRNDNPERIAAYTKAAHLKGSGGANNLFLRGLDGTDANGTSASKYANDGVLAMRNLAPQVAAVSASVPPPAVPSMPKPQAIAEAPQVMMPMGGESSRRNWSISIDRGDVGRDLSDRTLAHIVTGGLSRGA